MVRFSAPPPLVESISDSKSAVCTEAGKWSDSVPPPWLNPSQIQTLQHVLIPAQIYLAVLMLRAYEDFGLVFLLVARGDHMTITCLAQL